MSVADILENSILTEEEVIRQADCLQLVNGTKNISCPTIEATDFIWLARIGMGLGATGINLLYQGNISHTAIVPGVGFTINSSTNRDTSWVSYIVFRTV